MISRSTSHGAAFECAESEQPKAENELRRLAEMTVETGQRILPSLVTSQRDSNSSGVPVSGRFAWMKASA